MNLPGRETYRHGDLHAKAVEAALGLIAETGHERLSLRQVAQRTGVVHRSLYNHFRDREDLLNFAAAEVNGRLAGLLRKSVSARDYIATYVNFARANPSFYALMTSRPHGTMFQHPQLQSAVHMVITEAMRIFARPGLTSVERRRAVMKNYMLLYGGIMLHGSGILDVDGDDALIDELAAMAMVA